MKNGKVYLISITSDDTYYKIGFTTSDVKKRVKQLQTGNSETIEIVSEFSTVNYLKLEKMLHNKFYPQHIRGEWFFISKEQADNFIEECSNFDKIIESLKSSGNPFI